MFRPLFPCVFWIALLGLPMPCLAQPTLPEDDIDPHRADIKELAKAAFEASQADPHRLALKRRDAARTVFREDYGWYRSGRDGVTLEIIVKAAHQLLDAELAVCEDAAQRVAAHERFWRQMCSIENIVRGKYQVGRVARADYAQAQYERLNAEIHMIETRRKAKKK